VQIGQDDFGFDYNMLVDRYFVPQTRFLEVAMRGAWASIMPVALK
jgi:hypothetical protein